MKDSTNIYMRNIASQKGSVLVYSLLLMVTLSSLAFLTAFIVYVSIKSTRNSVDAITAFYSAESGIEMNLDQLKRYRAVKTLALNDDVLTASGLNAVNGSLTNSSATYSTALTQETNSLSFKLSQANRKQIELFNIDDGSALTNANAFSFDWEFDPLDTACVSPSLSVGYLEFNATALANDPSLIYQNNNYTYYLDSPPDFSSGMTATYSYMLELTPINCDVVINNLIVTDVSGNNINFPNYLTITSTGSKGNSKFLLTANTLWKAPMSDLGHFVLFSESEITK